MFILIKSFQAVTHSFATVSGSDSREKRLNRDLVLPLLVDFSP